MNSAGDSQLALQAMHADLDALATALLEEQHEHAIELQNRHDAALREFIDHQDLQAHAEALRGIHERQHRLMADMRERRDQASAQLRAGRQSVRAAQAYHQAERLQ